MLPVRDGNQNGYAISTERNRAPLCDVSYFLAGRLFMMLSISAISRGALLIRSSPAAVIT